MNPNLLCLQCRALITRPSAPGMRRLYCTEHEQLMDAIVTRMTQIELGSMKYAVDLSREQAIHSAQQSAAGWSAWESMPAVLSAASTLRWLIEKATEER